MDKEQRWGDIRDGDSPFNCVCFAHGAINYRGGGEGISYTTEWLFIVEADREDFITPLAIIRAVHAPLPNDNSLLYVHASRT